MDDDRLHGGIPCSSSYALGRRYHDRSTGQYYLNEVVWNGGCDHPCGTGGGISEVLDLPDYQINVNVSPSANPNGRIGRGVPGIADDADPSTGLSDSGRWTADDHWGDKRYSSSLGWMDCFV